MTEPIVKIGQRISDGVVSNIEIAFSTHPPYEFYMYYVTWDNEEWNNGSSLTEDELVKYTKKKNNAET